MMMGEEREKLWLGADFDLRFAGIGDISFILDSWCANQSDSIFLREVPHDVVKVELRARIRRLMSNLSNFVIAHPTPAWSREAGIDHSTRDVWGYCCYSFDRQTRDSVVHFTYVKNSLRGRKIASQMLQEAALIKPGQHFWTTATSSVGRRILYHYGGSYNPFFLEHLDALTNRSGVAECED